MHWDIIEGNWPQYRNHIKAQWARLTDDDLRFACGNRSQLAGQIQKAYGIGKDRAEQQITAFENFIVGRRES